MEIVSILLASLEAILTNASIAISGFLLSKFDYISEDMSNNIAKLNVNFFLPVMLFIKLSQSISINTLIQFWPIPLIWFITTFTSLLLTQVISKVVGQSKYLENFSKVATAFCNTNSIPTGIIHVLALGANSNWLKWGSKDTPEAMDARGISYIIVYTAFVNLARWSYGVKLFQLGDESQHLLESSQDSNNNNNNNTSEPLTLYKKLKPILSPPLIGIYCSIVIILVPGLKSLLFGDFFLFRSIQNGLSYLGDCTIPLILMNLGCQIYFVSVRSSNIIIKVPVTLILSVRFFLTPAIILGLLYLTKDYYTLGSDPIFQLTMIIVASGAPALNLVQISAYTNTYRDEVALLLLYSYILAVPCLTALVSLYLYIIPKWYQ